MRTVVIALGCVCAIAADAVGDGEVALGSAADRTVSSPSNIVAISHRNARMANLLRG